MAPVKTSACEDGEPPTHARVTLLLLADAEGVARGTVVSALPDTATRIMDAGQARPATEPDLVTWAREPVEI
jgi:hypothetical protein